MVNNLNIGFHREILSTVCNNVYTDVLIKIREACANSIDNNATLFSLNIDSNNKRMSLYDNGDGFTLDKLISVFGSIGHSDNKNISSIRNSYFGLGFPAVLSINDLHEAFILTKSKDSNPVLCKVNFSHNDPNNCIELIDNFNIEDYSIIDKNNKLFDHVPKETTSYTEIIFKKVKNDIILDLLDKQRLLELQKSLPLDYSNNDPFFSCIKDQIYIDRIKRIIDNSDYGKKIQFYFTDISKCSTTQLFKNLPHFDEVFDNDDIIFIDHHVPEYNVSCLGYVLSKKFDISKKSINGHKFLFDIRNNGFLLFENSNGFINKYPFVSDVIKNWIYGELFFININKFLTPSRDTLSASSDSNKLCKSLKDYFNTNISIKLKKIYNLNKKYSFSIIPSFNDLQETRLFDKLQMNLSRAYNEDTLNHFFNDISDKDDIELSNSPEVYRLIEEGSFEGIDDVTVDGITISSNFLNNERKESYIIFNESDTKVSISYYKNHFKEAQIKLFDMIYSVKYVSNNNQEKAYYIDPSNSSIYININAEIFLKYNISSIEVLWLIDHAYTKSGNKEDLRDNLKKLFSIRNVKKSQAIKDEYIV